MKKLLTCSWGKCINSMLMYYKRSKQCTRYATPILLEVNSVLWTDNKKFLVDLARSQRLASQSYLEREGTLQSENTFLYLSHAYTEIFPICDDSAVYKDIDSQKTSAENSKEVPLAGKEISMQCVEPTKALTSTRCAPACQQFTALSFWSTVGKSFWVINSCQSPCKPAPTYQFDQLFQSHTNCP